MIFPNARWRRIQVIIQHTGIFDNQGIGIVFSIIDDGEEEHILNQTLIGCSNWQEVEALDRILPDDTGMKIRVIARDTVNWKQKERE